MKKKLFLYSIFLVFSSLLIMILTGCQNKKTNSAIDYLDSLKKQEHLDSLVKNRIRDVFLADTLKSINAPVQIMNVELTNEGGREIKLTFKNVSTKDISAIRFQWYCLDAFNKPADMGEDALYEGLGGGTTEITLKVNEVQTKIWHEYESNLKRVLRAWITEVAFEDGTNWKSR